MKKILLEVIPKNIDLYFNDLTCLENSIASITESLFSDEEESEQDA